MKKILVVALSLLGAWITLRSRGQYCLPIFSGAGADALSGVDPYLMTAGRPDLFKYGPIWAILLVPLTLIPSVISPAFWYLANAAAFWRASWLFKRSLGRGTGFFSWIELLLLFPLMLANGFYGQINSILLLLIVEGWLRLGSKSMRTQSFGGLLLSLATWMKLFPAYLGVLAIGINRKAGGLLGLLLGTLLGIALPFLIWNGSTDQVFHSWFSVIRHDLSAPHHKIGLLALLLEAQVSMDAASLIQKGAALLFFSGLMVAKCQEGRTLALALSGFLFFSHMTEPPTLALLAPAMLVLHRRLDHAVLLLLLLVLPSDAVPESAKAILGGQYVIKTLGVFYCLMALIRSPGRTNSPG